MCLEWDLQNCGMVRWLYSLSRQWHKKSGVRTAEHKGCMEYLGTCICSITNRHTLYSTECMEQWKFDRGRYLVLWGLACSMSVVGLCI